MGCGRIRNSADRPIRGDPLPRSMRQDRGEIDQTRSLVDGGCLHGGNLVLAQSFAHNVEPARQRRIAANSAQALDVLTSTMRIASMRGLGGSTAGTPSALWPYSSCAHRPSCTVMREFAAKEWEVYCSL